MNLKFYTSEEKRVKTKSQKALMTNSYVCRSCRKKLLTSLFTTLLHPILNRVNVAGYLPDLQAPPQPSSIKIKENSANIKIDNNNNDNMKNNINNKVIMMIKTVITIITKNYIIRMIAIIIVIIIIIIIKMKENKQIKILKHFLFFVY